MAAIWKGSLTFGLVNIPVQLKTAVRADHISFRLLHAEDLSPVKYERVCQADGETVPWNEIVKGYEYDKGKFVVLTDEDFKTAALEHSKTIDILDFVKEDEIDPRHFETPYYLVPGKGAEKPYALLREAIRTTGSVGIGKIIIRPTQHLAGVKDSRSAQKTLRSNQAITRTRRRDCRTRRRKAGAIPGAAGSDACERVAPDRAALSLNACGTHSLRHSDGWRRCIDQRAVVRAAGSTCQANWQTRLEARSNHRVGRGRRKEDAREGSSSGWEGIIAKRIDSPYEPGIRSRNWLKLKIEFRQEFVVGGYTEPRNSREHIGALLLGYFDHDRFIYVGHTGGGFTRQGLEEMYRRLKPLERKTSPFKETPKTNEKAHWVKPEVLVEVKFSEWTADRRLRQPIFLGVRDDKDPKEVGIEPTSVQKKSTRKGAAHGNEDKDSVLAQLSAIEKKGGDGSLDFGRGKALKVSNLDKVFFPKEKYTKGDVMRYYTRIGAFILPTILDRPLVLKRFPNGIDSESFYQQKASETTPPEVRVEIIETDSGEKQPRIVGGDLLTLLYTIQLGAISVDPWHSRVQSLEYADYTIIDLDPGPRADFGRVVQIARWAKEVIDGFGLHAAIKTSGSTGLHIYLPLPPRTPNEASTLVAQMIATKVAESHPKEATIERFVKARGAATVYVDYLQNIQGKTVAGPYCVRAKPGATVSTPLKWSELTDDLDPRAFHLGNAPERFEKIGDIWNEAMKKKNSLRALV